MILISSPTSLPQFSFPSFSVSPRYPGYQHGQTVCLPCVPLGTLEFFKCNAVLDPTTDELGGFG
jgi:hypothetical protein